MPTLIPIAKEKDCLLDSSCGRGKAKILVKSHYRKAATSKKPLPVPSEDYEMVQAIEPTQEGLIQSYCCRDRDARLASSFQLEEKLALSGGLSHVE